MESSSKICVIARYQENVDWAQQLPEPWLPLLIQKGEHVPNVGREPHSFLWFILQAYDDIQPEQMFAFVQGNPFDHCPQLLKTLESCSNPPFAFLGKGDVFRSNGDGSPHHPGLPVGELYEKWFHKTFREPVAFAPGGQFLVSGEAILRRPKAFYQMLFEDVQINQQAWVLERTWQEVFNQ